MPVSVSVRAAVCPGFSAGPSSRYGVRRLALPLWPVGAMPIGTKRTSGLKGFGTPRSEGGLEAAINSFIRNQRDVDERLNDYGAARLTSITGFPLPPFGLDPPRMVGILSLILLAIAALGVYVFNISGPWRLDLHHHGDRRALAGRLRRCHLSVCEVAILGRTRVLTARSRRSFS